MWQRILTLIISPFSSPTSPTWVGQSYGWWGRGKDGGEGLNRGSTELGNSYSPNHLPIKPPGPPHLGFHWRNHQRRPLGGAIRRDVMRRGRRPPLHLLLTLLVYISPRDVIELNKAFLGGAAATAAVCGMSKGPTFGGHLHMLQISRSDRRTCRDSRPGCQRNKGARSCEQFTGRVEALSDPPDYQGQWHTCSHTHTNTDTHRTHTVCIAY